MANATGGDLFAGQQVPDFLRDEWVLLEMEGAPFTGLWFVQMRFAANDVDFQFLEIREDGEREIFVPRITFGLEGISRVKFFGGLLRFTDKPVAPVGTE